MFAHVEFRLFSLKSYSLYFANFSFIDSFFFFFLVFYLVVEVKNYKTAHRFLNTTTIWLNLIVWKCLLGSVKSAQNSTSAAGTKVMY